MDNLIAAGKAKPMIVVMDNLNAVKPGEDGSIFAARGSCLLPRTEPPRAGTRQSAGPSRRRAGQFHWRHVHRNDADRSDPDD